MFGFSLLNSGLLSLSMSELEITITTIYIHRTVCRYLITNISGLSLRGGLPTATFKGNKRKIEPKETPSCLIPRLLVILSQILKELVIKILEMTLRFYTYVIPFFKIDGIRSSQFPNQLHPVLVSIIFLSWSSKRRTRWPPKSFEFICRCCG